MCVKVIAVTLIVIFNQMNWFECNADQWSDLAGKMTKVAKSFKCGSPQPRSFMYTDLIEPDDLKRFGIILSVQPRMVVLHRCDAGSGCCLQQGLCSPEITENVDLAFTIFNNSNRGITITTTATNHTSCSCQAAKDLPK